MDLLRLFPLYLRLTAMNELQYRVNFIVQLFSSLLALTAGLVSLALIFSQTSDLNGWSRPELLVVMGVHLMMGGVIRAVIQPNMNRLIDDIHQGTLDYSLTKPADAQVLVSVREFRVWQVVDTLTGVVVLLVGVAELRAGVGLLHAAAFVVALILGAVMIYCFWLMLTTGAFWIIRMEFIVELFQGVYQAGAGRSRSTRTGCAPASPSWCRLPLRSRCLPKPSPGASQRRPCWAQLFWLPSFSSCPAGSGR